MIMYLLQASTGFDSGFLFGYFFSMLLAILFIARYVFSIPSIIKYQKIQARLLKLLAEKAGVSAEEIDREIRKP